MAAARLCASIALISTRKLVLDLHKVGTCPVLVKHCVILMHISVWGPGRNILCFFFLPFSVQRCFSASISTVFFVSLDLYSLLFCIKMKSETQNIYNFCMKKKECKTKQKTWENGNYFLLCWLRSGVRKKCYENTVISSFVANVCSLQQQGESTINSFWIQWKNWSSPAENLLQCSAITILWVFTNWHSRTKHA